jgi:ABC-type multidrug transport system ATPase subunit
MTEAKDLTKRYGDTLAVDDLSFAVQPGVLEMTRLSHIRGK